MIANVCLAYLLQFEGNLSPGDIIQHFPFAKYSAQYWMTNAAKAKDTNKLTVQLIQLFCSSESVYNLCYNLYQPDQPWLEKKELAKTTVAPVLYYAAIGGLLYTVRWLLYQGKDINTKGGFHGYAVQAASYKGCEQIVRLLVEKGADVNAQGGEHANAL